MDKDRPSRVRVLFKKAGAFIPAAALLLVGIGAFALALFHGLDGLMVDAVTVPIPGDIKFTPPGNGVYTVFLETEYKLSDADRGFLSSRLNVRLEDAIGALAPMTSTGFTGSYDFPKRHGFSLMRFDIPREGQFRIRVFLEDASIDDSSLTLIKNFGKRLVTIIITSLSILLAFFLAASAALYFALRPSKNSKDFRLEGPE